jgi:hypothetical protein
MAQKVVTTTTLIDDMDGQPIEDGKGETIRLSIDGTNYEVDLRADNARSLRDAVKPYLKNARQVSARRGGGGNRNNKEELAAARAWLRDNGHEVSDRGRIPNELMEMYRAAK